MKPFFLFLCVFIASCYIRKISKPCGLDPQSVFSKDWKRDSLNEGGLRASYYKEIFSSREKIKYYFPINIDTACLINFLGRPNQVYSEENHSSIMVYYLSGFILSDGSFQGTTFEANTKYDKVVEYKLMIN